MKRIKVKQKYFLALNDLINVLKNSGFLNNFSVEYVMRDLPRHEFVPISELEQAYLNKPLSIMNKQTISQPGVVSRMTEWLDVSIGQHILEIGTGSGWQTAILSLLVGNGTIHSIEFHTDLKKFAINNVHLILGDGGEGFQQAAPYDRIIITAACSDVPLPLFDQLKEGGLLVAPVGNSLQSLVLFKKTLDGIIEIKNQSNYVFVPLLGKFGKE